MECLDEETILAFCRGGLAADVRSRAEEHISTCDECRVLVSAVARSSFSDLAAPASAAETLDEENSPEDREDRPPVPMLRARLDLGMAPTTPSGGAGADSGARPATSPVAPGQILAGKFEVERVLGAGGMGVVVAARHTQLGQRVALKFLLPAACEVPGAVARFLREGKAAARITSEHVARVMDTGVLDGSSGPGGAPYLVMEYLEGSDLGALVQARGALPAEEAVEYVLQACEAIVEAHDLGIVHRDLKPANLFLTHRADGSPLVKVLDFGISKVEGGGSRSELLTSASVLMGSPRYMSPEQMLSAKDVDARTDVWAIGVILYELVCAKPVWHADTMQGLCALIASSPAPSLLASAPKAPAVLDAVVAKCLAKSRDERIASVADLALALEPIAPAGARTSIERILRVARKDRTPSVHPRSHPQPSGGASASALATTADRERHAAPRVGWVLGIAVAALLVVGVTLNATRRAPPETPAPQASAAPLPLPPPSSPPTLAATAPSASSAPPPTFSVEPAAPSASAPSPTPAPPTSVARRPVRPSPSATTQAMAVPSPPPPTTTPETKAPPPPSPSSRALTDRK
jgi:serine/threonine-protein kinase